MTPTHCYDTDNGVLHSLSSLMLLPPSLSSLPLTSPTCCYLLYPLLFLLLTFLLLRQHLTHQKSLSPLPSLPSPPGAHWLHGHIIYTIGPPSSSTTNRTTGETTTTDNFARMFVQHANPAGLTAFWAFHRRCIAVLDARHARTILKHGSDRSSLPVFARHGKKTLGEESLIFLEGGVRWKKQRSLLAKAFGVQALVEGRMGVVRVVRRMCVSLWRLCEREEERRNGSNGNYDATSTSDGSDDEKNTDGDGGGVEIDVLVLAKMFTMQVFGKLALGVDFRLISDHDDYTRIDMNCYSAGNDDGDDNDDDDDDGDEKNNENEEQNLRVVKLSTQAKAFEFLLGDMTLRCKPSSLLNPLLQTYWFPTRHNREYHKMNNIVKDLMKEIIEQGNDALISKNVEKDDANHQKAATHGTTTNNGTNARSTNGSTNKATKSATTTKKKKRDNMLTNIISAYKDASPKGTTINANDSNLISSVQKVITTLFFAGYETTAITISYALYNLSKYPRCQERIAQEARRIFGDAPPVVVTDSRVNTGSDGNNDNHGSDSDSTTNEDNNNDDDIHRKISEDNLRYTFACIMESMRLCPTVLQTARDATKPIDLDGYIVPAGTRLYIPLTKLHVSERNFERPNEFCPERWVRWLDDEKDNHEGNDLNNSSNGGGGGSGRWVERDYEEETENKNNHNDDDTRHQHQHLPNNPGPPSKNPQHQSQNIHAETISAANPKNFLVFSDGARNCVGKRLAILETTMVISMIIKDFVVERDGEKPLEMKRRLVSFYPERMPIIFKKRCR